MIISSVVPSQGATTLLEILEELRGLGFDQQFAAQPGGSIKCASCSFVFDAAESSRHQNAETRRKCWYATVSAHVDEFVRRR